MFQMNAPSTIASKNDLAFASLEQLARLLASRDISCVELTRFFLDRIRMYNEELHAFCDVLDQQALHQAAQRDAERRMDKRLGPLHGIPVAIKGIFDVAGCSIHAGSMAMTDRHPKCSAHAVAKLEAAGMVILGRTHMVEFAFGGWGTNPVMGAPRNPWDRKQHRVAGGSSSGSAVAVSAGLIPAALGTDTGGSVRTPATWCGLIGLKTSHGLIGRGGVVPLCPTHDTVGTFTRTIHDAATMLDAMVGPDFRDDITRLSPKIDALGEIRLDISGLKIGRLRDTDLEGVDPGIRRLHDIALADLEVLGARLEEVELPLSISEYLQSGGEIMSFESYRELARYVEPEPSLVDPVIRARIMAGREISKEQYCEILRLRLEAQKAYAINTKGFDAVVTPGSHQVAVLLADVNESAPSNLYGRVVNFLDLAAVAVPTGLTTAGLPAGIQIVVRKFEDAKALRIGAALEAARGGLTPVPPGF